MKEVWEDRKGFSVELKEAVATTRYHALLIPVVALYLNRGLPGSAVYDLSTVRHSSRDFLCRIWYPFEVRAEIEVRLIHTFQPQEMHSAKGISGNDRPIIMRHGACCHVRIHG
jgi:hypothetical protein